MATHTQAMTGRQHETLGKFGVWLRVPRESARPPISNHPTRSGEEMQRKTAGHPCCRAAFHGKMAAGAAGAKAAAQTRHAEQSAAPAPPFPASGG